MGLMFQNNSSNTIYVESVSLEDEKQTETEIQNDLYDTEISYEPIELIGINYRITQH